MLCSSPVRNCMPFFFFLPPVSILSDPEHDLAQARTGGSQNKGKLAGMKGKSSFCYSISGMDG